MTGKLVICATPIGNLGDASPRLLEALRSADLIAAEDTRRTLNLLRHFGIVTQVLSYHEHSTQHKHEALLHHLSLGKTVALVSDAGTPGISDPGEELIRDAIDGGVEVTIIPGPMAGVAALVISGLPTGRFAFEGFLPRGKRERRQVLANLQSEARSLVFYEAPHRIKDTLGDMYDAWGDRRAALVRELTKAFEEVKRGTLSQLLDHFAVNEARGEMVLVIEGNDAPPSLGEGVSPEHLLEILLSEGYSPAQAVRRAVKQCNMPREELYRLAMQLGNAQE
ncbi:MAG: 16S rRNA (cytidine(1402)-2'-O)-methyltransferase [Peptococcaceae bacterium]|nr:16S rRNA (cytidine(1402)-2'-O)-methyltransferase [Peptococcaceae bacterium]